MSSSRSRRCLARNDTSARLGMEMSQVSVSSKGPRKKPPVAWTTISPSKHALFPYEVLFVFTLARSFLLFTLVRNMVEEIRYGCGYTVQSRVYGTKQKRDNREKNEEKKRSRSLFSHPPQIPTPHHRTRMRTQVLLAATRRCSCNPSIPYHHRVHPMCLNIPATGPELQLTLLCQLGLLELCVIFQGS